MKAQLVLGLAHHILCLFVPCLQAQFPPSCIEHACRICAMRSIPTALLCLGLCLCQRICTQKQTLSKPVIWAKPHFMVPRGSPVNIWCQGIREAVVYQLHFEGMLYATERPKLPECSGKVKFLVPAMTSHTAGQYTCFYWNGELWSEPSAPLDLVMTGMYDTPTLSVHPGPEVALEENVTFYCHLETATGTFFLLKEGRSSSLQHRRGNIQAEFPMGPATEAHKGTYRCFGSYNNHMWSFPSEPVKLLVTGDAGNTSHAPTDPTSSPDSWDPCLGITESGFSREAAQNLFRIGLAFLVLVALVWLLVEERFSRKRARRGANRTARWECRRLRMQSSLEAGPSTAGGSDGSSLAAGRGSSRLDQWRREASQGSSG